MESPESIVSDNQATVRYSFRLRPGKIAEDRLALEWNCARWVWNQCVEAGNTACKAREEGVEHESPTWCRMAKKLTAWRAKFEWLRDGSRVAQSQAIRKWAMSYHQAFKQPAMGFPQFKSSKHSLPSIAYDKNSFRLRNGCLSLVGDISIPVVWSRALPSIPRSCVITRDSEGYWSVSFVVRRKPEKFPPSAAAIGIDWGVKTVATTTEPAFDLACGDQIKNNAKALRLANRKLSRAKRESKGHARAKKKRAAIHAKITRQRKDRAFKWARKLVANFGKIAVEDFKPAFLAKSTMAKKATDGAIGMTKKILLTMAAQAGRTVALVDPAYTTQTCASCGTRTTTKLTLKDRIFTCSCGYTADRDENAARVILARAGFNPTDVDDVRPEHDAGCALAV